MSPLHVTRYAVMKPVTRGPASSPYEIKSGHLCCVYCSLNCASVRPRIVFASRTVPEPSEIIHKHTPIDPQLQLFTFATRIISPDTSQATRNHSQINHA